MLGILLISHGKMAEGMKDSLSMFFGNDIPQLDTLALRMDSSAVEFGQEIRQKVAELDTGDGVLIFADVLGGTPCNQALQIVNEKVHLIVGMNLPMLMELLGIRESQEIDVAAVVESGKNAVIDAGAMLMSDSNEEVDDD